MNGSQQKARAEMRARIRLFLAVHAACLAVLVAACAVMYATSGYYASAYPYKNFTALPRNSTTFLLSIFNGYSEKVPLGANLSAIAAGIGGIRGAATASVNGTIWELILAFATLALFGLLSIILEGRAKAGARRDSKPYRLPVIFVAILVLSQYALSSQVWLRGHTISGISLFFVDALATVIFFGSLDERLMYRFMKRLKGIKSRSGTDFGRAAKAMKVLMALWPPVLLLITLLLLTNLGLFSYNQSFLHTYLAHSAGLYEFAALFALVLYMDEFYSLIKRLTGSVRKPGAAKRS